MKHLSNEVSETLLNLLLFLMQVVVVIAVVLAMSESIVCTPPTYLIFHALFHFPKIIPSESSSANTYDMRCK